MPWVKMRLRGDVVFAQAKDDGSLVVDGGLVPIQYRLGAGQKTYRAAQKNLEAPAGEREVIADPTPEAGKPAAVPAPAKKRAKKGPAPLPPAAPAGTIIIYTDGACSGNPGPMGLGVVIVDGARRLEIGEFLGDGTNNIAELTAVERALQAIPKADRGRPIWVHVDSEYTIGSVTKPWKPKANIELIARLKVLAREFPYLRFVKVAGHAGVPENERCDELATEAVSTRTTQRQETTG